MKKDDDVNILCLGPAGAGKSTFVNSLISGLSSEISKVNISGGKASGITSQLLMFELKKFPAFSQLRFNIYDCPGVESDNYLGEELPMILEGVLPPDEDILNNKRVCFSQIVGRRSSPEEERKRRISTVVFFVPSGVVTDVLEKLADLYADVTIKYKRKAVVVISKIDLCPSDEEKKEVLNAVCTAFAIDSSSVFFLQNYVDAKNKLFQVDTGILEIIVAALKGCDDFQLLAASTNIQPLFPATSSPRKPSNSKKVDVPQKSAVITAPMDQFINLLPAEMRSFVKEKLESEEITDIEMLSNLSVELWKMMGMRVVHIAAIQAALKQMSGKGNTASFLSTELETFLSSLDENLRNELRPLLISKGTTFSQLCAMNAQDFKLMGLSMGKAVTVVQVLKNKM